MALILVLKDNFIHLNISKLFLCNKISNDTISIRNKYLRLR